MTRIFITRPKIIFLLLSLLATIGFEVQAQTPEIPSNVSFGGITVKFDRSAQNLIEEDVKSLMSNKKFWEEKMERAILYFPIVEGILMDEEVPIDFKYLAVQESSFRPDVVSSSNAVGYWQFKPETARELNLRVDDEIDERKNISSSTHAAAWYLKKNNQQFNNWVSALYSYYQGAGGVKKIVPANWAYAREVTLNGKTDRYMLRFFAHKIALEAGIERFRSNNKIVLLESEYGKGQTFDEIAKSLGINSRELESYNKWITKGSIPTDREYLVTIPVAVDQVASVREKLSLPAAATASSSSPTAIAANYDETGFPVLKKSKSQSNDKNAPTLYEINGLPGIEARADDDAKSLAKAGGVRMPKFRRLNDLVKEMPLIPGQVYYLSKKNKKAATPFHTARPGDTWHSVSQQYGLRLVSLLNYNRTLSRNYPIQTGQVLWLTKKRPKKQPIEIIKPTTPAPTPTPAEKETPVIASAPATAPSATVPATNDIPEKPSGRKKYTPVLVDKAESSIAKEDKSFEKAATPQVTTPVAKDNNDRVVIITQDDDDNAFKTGNDNSTGSKKSSGTESKTPVEQSAANSVYARKQREIAERNAAEKAAAEKEIASKPVKEAVPASSSEGKAGFHIVKSGETYFSIARKYGMNVTELSDLNNVGGRKGLIVGQKLRVKDLTGAVVETERPTVTSSPTGPTRIEKEAQTIVADKSNDGTGKFHTVQPGETYYGIARTYGISLKELMLLNNMSAPSKLVSGEKLRVGTGAGRNAASPATSAPTGFTTHTVSSGETLFRISQKYGVSVEEIKRLNKMTSNSVSVGQRVRVPQK